MSKYRLDMRSDIHSVPTDEMRQAMAQAEVGGDALKGEDAAVNELEATAAVMFRKDAALLVCSGTTGNLVSLLALCERGSVIIADPWTHIVSSEMNGFERLAGCNVVPIETDGILTGDMVRQCLGSHSLMGRHQVVICVENTHGLRGGIAWGPDVMRGLTSVACEHGLKLHIDGARIFNASAATGASVADLTAGADTVQVCLAKGLGAPCGSLILGSADVIDRARQYRQMLGGGIHKAGIYAAAGLVALRRMPQMIAEDHRRARRLADLIASLPCLRLAHPVQTNIVDVAFESQAVDGRALVQAAARRDIGIAGPWTGPWGGWLRLVTHYGISDADIEETAASLSEVLRDCFKETALAGEPPVAPRK